MTQLPLPQANQIGSRTEPIQEKHKRFWFDVLPTLLVLTIALFSSAQIYLQFLDTSRFLWKGIDHDRSAHYAYGQKMAIALRQGDVVGFISELEKGKVWPPVHGLLVALVLLVGGVHYQLAVLPSLTGWIMTVVFGFLVARRSIPSRGGGLLAGIVAVIFIVGSPAHRAYATDIMLESLGGGLTLLALYLYLLAVQRETSLWAWRGLALTLTVLFFEKYNYWLLTTLPMLTTEFATRPRQYLRTATMAVKAVNWPRWVMNQVRHPLTYVLVAVMALVIFLFARGPTAIQIAGSRVSLYPPNNLLTIAYAVLFLRVAMSLRPQRSQWLGRLSTASQQLWRWHILPVLLSFLLPRRLGVFAWYISPANAYYSGLQPGLSGAPGYYAEALITNYHVGLWSVLLVIALLAAAVLCCRRLPQEVWVVLFLVLIAAVVTVLHPNRQDRFLHTWIAAAWVGAGMGLGCVLYGRPSVLLRRARPWLAIGVVVLLAFGHRSQWLAARQPAEAEHQKRDSSVLDLTDTYLPHLARSPRTTIFTTVPSEALIQWTYLERYPRREGLESPGWRRGLTPEQLRDRFEAWLKSTRSDSVVLIDIHPGSYFYTDIFNDFKAYGQLSQLLAGQTIFRQTRRWDLPRYDCTITLWRRHEPT